MISEPERLASLLPSVVADLAARHHQPRPTRLELDVTEQAERHHVTAEAQVVRPTVERPDAEPEDNPRAAVILGKRTDDLNEPTLVINFPSEEGFHCPVCTYLTVDADGEFDERLAWSEYRTMLWCHECERDYPSALCLPDDPQRAVSVYLDCVAAILRSRPTHPRTWAAGLDDGNEAPRDLTLIDGDGDTWTCDELGGWVPRGPEIEDGYSFDWAAALSEARALRETVANPSPVLPSGGQS